MMSVSGGMARYSARSKRQQAAVAVPEAAVSGAPASFELPAGLEGLRYLEAAEGPAVKNGQTGYEPERFENRANPAIKHAHGTTTMAFIFEHGVLIAVDSRASMGSYIGSGTVEKFIPISKYLCGTMAGGAADCSFWERNLAMRCRLHELREGRRISTTAASKMLGNTVYSYRGMGLSMGTMICGWDEATGPALFYVDSDGTRLKGERFSVGSGATFAYGVLDQEYRYDMSVDEAVELGKRAIWHATHRDAYSGGTINVYCITKDGWKQYFRGDMNSLYYGQYAEERKAEAAARAAKKDADGDAEMAA